MNIWTRNSRKIIKKKINLALTKTQEKCPKKIKTKKNWEWCPKFLFNFLVSNDSRNSKIMNSSPTKTQKKCPKWPNFIKFLYKYIYLMMRKDSAYNSGPDSYWWSHKWGGLGYWRTHCLKWIQHQKSLKTHRHTI